MAWLHGWEYSRGYGLDYTFEAYVARSIGEFALALRDDPDAGRVWIAEDEDGIAGCIAVTRSSETHGMLHWFLVAERARGQGLGRRLLSEAIEYARERFDTVGLETFSELTTAGHLYRSVGFRLRDSTPQAEWGREINLQRYDIRFG
ncbi:MAG TPA: GNAT family N-acetyltransferase [Thermoleophilaceae bacterium]|jgi:GNAT superfamily N-acetyltransferase